MSTQIQLCRNEAECMGGEFLYFFSFLLKKIIIIINCSVEALVALETPG